MSKQVGGGPRFHGPGSLWKSSWRGRAPFSQICCVQGFGADIFGQYYIGAPVEIVPASGFFLGVLVGVSEIPAGTEPIVRNQDAGNPISAGWRLAMFPQLAADGITPGVGFNFTIYDGGGVPLVSLATAAGEPLYTATEQQFYGPSKLIEVFVGFEPPSGSFPDGQAVLLASSSSDSGVLSGPYVAGASVLTVGREDLAAFSAPNCIAGIVAGQAQFGEAAVIAQSLALAQGWAAAILDAGQVVAVPDTGITGFTNTNGWRVVTNASAGSPAPNPLDDFIDANPLSYANGDPLANDLTIGCMSPIVITGP